MLTLTLSLGNIGSLFPNTPGLVKYSDSDGENTVVLAGNIRVSSFDILMENPDLEGKIVGVIPTKSIERAEKMYLSMMMHVA